MSPSRQVAVVLFVLALISQSTALACSTLMIPDSKAKLMGKNYVWHLGHGQLFHNRSGMKKKALLDGERFEAKEWVSRFVSLTFNQFAENFPIGGMNAEGLAIEVLLAGASYPATTNKPVINELQWVQYLLDTAANVPEAIERAKEIEIMPLGRSSVHFHLCDRTGECAAAEYVRGRLVISHPKENGICPLSVTNSLVADQAPSPAAFSEGLIVDALEAQLLPKSEPIRKATRTLKGPEGDVAAAASTEEEVSRMYRALERMSGAPQWQIVYELANNRVHFKTQVGARQHHTVAFSDFDREYDKGCRKAAFFHKELGAWLVIPPARFDLGSRLESIGGGRVSVLERANFSFKTSGLSLLQQSDRFLRSTGLSTEMLEKLRLYQSTHTSCPQSPEEEKENSDPTVSSLVAPEMKEVMAYFSGKDSLALASYQTAPTQLDAIAGQLAVQLSKLPVAKEEKPVPVAGLPTAQSPKEDYEINFRFYYDRTKGLRVASAGPQIGYRNVIEITHAGMKPDSLRDLSVYVAPVRKQLCSVSWGGGRAGWLEAERSSVNPQKLELPFFLYANQRGGLDTNQFHVALKHKAGQIVFNKYLNAPISLSPY